MWNWQPHGISHEGQALSRQRTKSVLLFCSLKVDEVTVDSIDITMAADEIQVHSAVTANIGGKG